MTDITPYRIVIVAPLHQHGTDEIRRIGIHPRQAVIQTTVTQPNPLPEGFKVQGILRVPGWASGQYAQQVEAALLRSLAQEPETRRGDRLDLRFDVFSSINARRCQRWHPGFPNDSWTGADWSNAMAGEAGEAANVVKKLRRIELSCQGRPSEQDRKALVQDLAEEIADVVIYADLLATFYGIDLAGAVVAKFNRTSEEFGFLERLPESS